MAGPHVAGVVALMRQANPDLEVAAIKEILMATARDLGEPGEDNTYGHGLIDAYAAVLAVMNTVGSVAGTVTESTKAALTVLPQASVMSAGAPGSVASAGHDTVEPSSAGAVNPPL